MLKITEMLVRFFTRFNSVQPYDNAALGNTARAPVPSFAWVAAHTKAKQSCSDVTMAPGVL